VKKILVMENKPHKIEEAKRVFGKYELSFVSSHEEAAIAASEKWFDGIMDCLTKRLPTQRQEMEKYVDVRGVSQNKSVEYIFIEEEGKNSPAQKNSSPKSDDEEVREVIVALKSFAQEGGEEVAEALNFYRQNYPQCF
jgi:hypothetical protein